MLKLEWWGFWTEKTNTDKVSGKAVRSILNMILPLCQFCLADCQKALCTQTCPYTKRIWPWDLLDLLLAANFIALPHLATSRTICFLSKFTHPPGYTSCWFFSSLREARGNNTDSGHPKNIFSSKINFIATAEFIYVSWYPNDFLKILLFYLSLKLPKQKAIQISLNYHIKGYLCCTEKW